MEAGRKVDYNEAMKQLVIILGIGVVVIGAWWTGKNQSGKAVVTNDLAPITEVAETPTEVTTETLAPTTAPTTTAEKDNSEELIVAALTENHDKNVNEVRITVTRREGDYVKGSVAFSPFDPSNSGMFLAMKKGDGWSIEYEGNGIMDCKLLKAEGFPKDMIANGCD